MREDHTVGDGPAGKEIHDDSDSGIGSADPASTLVADLRRPRHRVSPKARHMWRLGSVVASLFVLVPVAAVGWFAEESRPWSFVALGLVAAWTLVLVIVTPEWRYRVHRWEVDDLAVYSLVGWISQTSRVAPVSRIQTVDSHYGPIARLFGLGTLKVTTASAAGAITIEGLERHVVEELVARLTTVTAADPGDAT